MRRQFQRIEQAAGLDLDRMVQTVVFLQRLAALTVIHEGTGLVHLLVQAAAKGHVHFLEAPADAQHRHARRHGGAQQRQGHRIAGRVMQGAGLAGCALVVMGLDIGGRTGEQQTVQALEQGRGGDEVGQGRDHHRHALGALHHRAQILVASDVKGMQA